MRCRRSENKSLGSGGVVAAVKCPLTYWLIALLCTIVPMSAEFCLATTLLYTIVDASHIRLACCC